jgi:hypothetical protein
MKSRLAILLILGVWGMSCSTTQVQPLPEIPPEPPKFTYVPHPEGLDLGDIRAIFHDQSAPTPEALKDCDADFNKLHSLTQSKVELEQGALEFVSRDPVKYHWCFYSKLLGMEDELKKAAYLDERQNLVIRDYQFLAPIARAFMAVYKDSRYLRWAIARYSRLSEFVFYRKVEMTPQTTADLMNAANPFDGLRPSSLQSASVLVKYGIVDPAAPTAPAEGAPVPAVNQVENVSTTQEPDPLPVAPGFAEQPAPATRVPASVAPAPAQAAAPAPDDLTPVDNDAVDELESN